MLVTLVALLLAPQDESVRKVVPKKGDSCTRHLMNTSSGNWTFSYSALSGNSVLFIPLNARKKKTRSRVQLKASSQVVGPYAQFQMIYTSNFLGRISGTWTITDQNGVSRSFQYNNYINDCPYISHDGNTGSVSVNDPDNGDISIGAATW